MCRKQQAKRLQIPSGIPVPVLPPREASRAREAYLTGYRRHPGLWGPVEMNTHDFLLVWQYPFTYGDDVLKFMGRGGVQGHSLYIHEWFEVDHYFSRGLNPYKRPFVNDLAEYGSAHARALLEEHRYLQMWAVRYGLRFSLRELIRHNPIAADPNLDWYFAMRHLPDEFSPFDCVERANKKDEIYNWFRALGFQDGR